MSIFRAMSGVPGTVSARLSATCGVDCSPESTSTHGNAAAMARRNVTFEGNVYCCEWHAKLLPTIDRIHFFPGFAGDKVLVGIFTDHLPT